MDGQGRATEAVPLYSYDFAALNLTTPCALASDDFPCTTDAGEAGRAAQELCVVGPAAAPATPCNAPAPALRHASVPASRSATAVPAFHLPPGAVAWDNSGRVYGNAQRLRGDASQPYTVPCVDGEQRWDHVSSALHWPAQPGGPAAAGHGLLATGRLVGTLGPNRCSCWC